jgi:hypothetical protein
VSIFKKIYNTSKQTYKKLWMFSPSIAFIDLMRDILIYCEGKHLPKISRMIYQPRHKLIMGYLYSKYHLVIDRYKDVPETAVKSETAPVWVCWLQGEETAPALVRQCIASIRHNAGKHPVIIITDNNIDDYIQLPTYIKSKYHSGLISRTHLSDVLRVCLLAEHGGLWLDSTVFCSKSIPDDIFQYYFFTCKNHINNDSYRFVSLGRWKISFLGSMKNSLFINYMKELLLKYWENESCVIDYFLTDYAIALAFEHLPIIKNEFSALPTHNWPVNKLMQNMNRAFDKEIFHGIINSDTLYYKLSYKDDLKEYTADGQKTFYYYFIRGFNIAN